nr:MAG TPA: hypothetical protein [Caudoviricetes sp.]
MFPLPRPSNQAHTIIPTINPTINPPNVHKIVPIFLLFIFYFLLSLIKSTIA